LIVQDELVSRHDRDLVAQTTKVRVESQLNGQSQTFERRKTLKEVSQEKSQIIEKLQARLSF
jgi:hypothetical protein